MRQTVSLISTLALLLMVSACGSDGGHGDNNGSGGSSPNSSTNSGTPSVTSTSTTQVTQPPVAAVLAPPLAPPTQTAEPISNSNIQQSSLDLLARQPNDQTDAAINRLAETQAQADVQIQQSATPPQPASSTVSIDTSTPATTQSSNVSGGSSMNAGSSSTSTGPVGRIIETETIVVGSDTPAVSSRNQSPQTRNLNLIRRPVMRQFNVQVARQWINSQILPLSRSLQQALNSRNQLQINNQTAALMPYIRGLGEVISETIAQMNQAIQSRNLGRAALINRELSGTSDTNAAHTSAQNLSAQLPLLYIANILLDQMDSTTDYDQISVLGDLSARVAQLALGQTQAYQTLLSEVINTPSRR